MFINKRKLTLGVLLLLLTCICLVLFYDNTDHTTRLLRTESADVRMLSAKSPDLLELFENEFREKVAKLDELISQKTEAAKGQCLKDPDATKDTKEQLQSFVEGQCAPVILVPGLMCTKLMVEIDCDTLQQNHPEIMDACGWSTCSWSLVSSRPAKEYVLWISDPLTHLSILSIRNSSTCFGRFVTTEFNASATSVDQRYSYPKGTRVTWYGNTPKTKSGKRRRLSCCRKYTPFPCSNPFIERICFYN